MRVSRISSSFVYLSIAAFIIPQPVASQENSNTNTNGCELHIWPTTNYGGVFFHAGNFKSDGAGTSFDLIDTVLPTVGVKTIAAFGTDEQLKVLGDSIRSSGKFAGYKIVPHVPLPQEQAARYLNLMDPSVGTGIRDSLSPANCYAEMHVSFITAFRTNLSKMLMTGFVVRYFPEEPSGPATKIIHSKPQRGEERIGFSNFDFSSATVKPEERTAVSAAFKFMADRFLRKKVKLGF